MVRPMVEQVFEAVSDTLEDIGVLVDSSDEEQQRSSPPKTPMLRPAPFPVVLDVLP
eukprot:CAMPEP_0172713564 /NCGR_PEP_ID=MMETSP1074-20121228/62870_1 /TAXON_ID=2916 /ORGANISM="Ceratium fusus, Strain PA161109" /LENGTH=55 /DNA_ID=CAMNT_0013537697 /DNA_START=1 /DNA_END=165 /DNA_ORIENTATION=+